MAVADRNDGTLIVANPLSEVIVNVSLIAEPCPGVIWSLNGSTIFNNTRYTISDPCGVGAQTFFFTFTLAIARISLNTSGQYSAVFTNAAGSTSLPSLIVAVPGKFSK